MIKSISVGSKVICTDGPGGITTAVIVDPVSHSLTHLAVVEESDPARRRTTCSSPAGDQNYTR